MTKSSPVLKKKALQDSLILSRHKNIDRTNKFKNKGIQ